MYDNEFNFKRYSAPLFIAVIVFFVWCFHKWQQLDMRIKPVVTAPLPVMEDTETHEPFIFQLPDTSQEDEKLVTITVPADGIPIVDKK